MAPHWGTPMSSHDDTHRSPCAWSETALLRDISYYEDKATDLERSSLSGRHGMITVYRYSAQLRRKMLAALRDGRPDAWREYPG